MAEASELPTSNGSAIIDPASARPRLAEAAGESLETSVACCSRRRQGSRRGGPRRSGAANRRNGHCTRSGLRLCDGDHSSCVAAANDGEGGTP
jgi:hypothetical protein